MDGLGGVMVIVSCGAYDWRYVDVFRMRLNRGTIWRGNHVCIEVKMAHNSLVSLTYQRRGVPDTQ